MWRLKFATDMNAELLHRRNIHFRESVKKINRIRKTFAHLQSQSQAQILFFYVLYFYRSHYSRLEIDFSVSKEKKTSFNFQEFGPRQEFWAISILKKGFRFSAARW